MIREVYFTCNIVSSCLLRSQVVVRTFDEWSEPNAFLLSVT